MSKITWISCHDPATGVSRRCAWVGATRQVVVTRLPPNFVTKAPRSFDLPSGAEIHEVPRDADGVDLALRLRGVLFTCLAPSEDD